MAYADSIRSATATLEQIATLIEGIFSSTYPLNWTTWSPTYTASGAMTYTGVTTYAAKYIQIGKIVYYMIAHGGTIGGTLSNYIGFSPPITLSGNHLPAAVKMFDSAVLSGSTSYGTTTRIDIFRYNGANYSAGSCIFHVAGFIEVP